MHRPSIGTPVLLVYRECPCGEWLATGEGALAPKCDQCGGYFVPGGGGHEGEPMFGQSHRESRMLRCLGFVAVLTTETGAAGLVRRARRFFGFDLDDAPYVEQRVRGRDGGYYLEHEREQASREILEDKGGI